MKNPVEDFLSAEDEKAIIESIRLAEQHTSGEIRVHLEATTQLDHFDRAKQLFHLLHMNNTKHGNGVLIYIAVEDKKLVILGDEGINKVVPTHFWERTKDVISASFKSGAIRSGLEEAIHLAGQQLKEYFPYQMGDINELPNEISKES
jgi:uncharacterized membrane protein